MRVEFGQGFELMTSVEKGDDKSRGDFSATPASRELSKVFQDRASAVIEYWP